ncbi:M24 family metallopeptidase [Candidatus Woesearchaeota archaeon]|nr:M24 family metallopeptidase [Candidatus Woesearchaeota archaeon]
MGINEFKAILNGKKSDIAIFYNSDSMKFSPNMFYFSGYMGLGALVMPKNKQSFLVVPEMEFQRAKNAMIKRVYRMETRKNHRFLGPRKFKKFSREKKFFESIYGIIKRNKLKTRNIAIDKNNFTLNSYSHFKKQFKKIKTKDISVDCMKLREIKTEREIQLIKKSCSYADKIVKKAISNFRDFKTESEASAFLEYEAKKNGLGLSFEPIVASGSNGSMPHHNPSNAKIRKGFCVIDFGVKYKGYCSDITRTVYIGKPTEKEMEMYNMLLKIQKSTISQISLNKKCSELYDYVTNNLGKHKNNFIHGLGHGVGIEIHELPNLTLNSKDKIKNNMVFTVEPGIYFPRRFGIRIEDTILFKNKPIALTKASKDLLIL